MAGFSKDSVSKINVALAERSYEILIGEGLTASVPDLNAGLLSATRAFVVCDKNVENTGSRILESFESKGIKGSLNLLPPGENQKCLETASRLYDLLVDEKADRKTLVVAVGGGVIGDLAGFVASTFNRGLKLFMIPTTLLSMVDSSVGGKVGVNHPKGKNLIGAFHQPVGVAIDISTLNTLPEREFKSGLAEIVKYGVILDPELFEFLERESQAILKRSREALIHIIKRSCELKALVVSKDEREETGLRAILNYGHTYAHAFETEGGYGMWLHGEAVSAGMVCAARLAVARNMVGADFLERLKKLLKAFGLPVESPKLDPRKLLEIMRNDKKSVQGRLRLVLPIKLGQVDTFDGIPEEQVLASLE